MPTTPPMNRKPTVSRSKGSSTIVEQTSPTKARTFVATVPRSASRVAIVGVVGVVKNHPFLISQLRESSRPKIPMTPPMNRKPTVSRSRG